MNTINTSNSDINIECPGCHATFPLSEAVAHRIRDELNHDFDAKRKLQEKAFAQRDRELREKQEELEKAQKTQDDRLQAQLATERAKMLAQATKTVEEKLGIEMKSLQAQIQEKSAKLTEAQENELKLRKKQRDLEEKQAGLELEVQRKVAEECDKVRDAAKKQAHDEQQLNLAAKEKVISDLQKQIDALKLKAEQGSQKLQGRVLELDIEERLKTTFPFDKVEAVRSGVHGGDIHHIVRTNIGAECGSILWEAKRTNSWGGNWAAKVKDDQRHAKADIAVIVSRVLPNGVCGFGQVEGVWVCDYECVEPLAIALRDGLIGIATTRLAQAGQQGKMHELYNYVCGTEFRHRVQALVEAFSFMQQGIETEKRAMDKIWAAREKQLRRALQSTAEVYGHVQGILGQVALPEVQALQLEKPDDQAA